MADHLVRITLHVTEQGLVTGGAYEWYDRGGDRVGCVVPGPFAEPQPPEQAFDYLYGEWLAEGAIQQPLF